MSGPPPPKKDFAASHGMTHGGFRDFLATKGEAKTSEQKATERAVERARAAAVARSKVAAMQAGGREMGDKHLAAELKAQAARARALAHLQKHSCGPSEFEKTGVAASFASGTRDNTLEVASKRKAAEQAKASAVKQQLLAQQAALRGRLLEQAAGGGGTAGASEAVDLAELPPHWQEVPDPSSAGVYYWNEATNETTWDRPRAAGATPAVVPAAAPEAAAPLPAGWRRVLHAATGQTVYEHQETKERRWEPPTGEGGAGGAQPSAAAVGQLLAAPVKFSLGGIGAAAKRKVPAAASGGGGGGDGGDNGGGVGSGKSSGGRGDDGKRVKFDWQKSRKIDPMDPTGAEAGKGGKGPDGERMADSTASGPLFQQRPYPAPGSVLRGQQGKK